MRTGEVVAIEALARWQTDDGVREPGEFLPGIEQAGLQRLVVPSHARRWPRRTWSTFRNVSPNLRLAVNFDFDSIPATGLRKAVTDLPKKHDVPLELISLELSERQSFDLSPATLARTARRRQGRGQAGAR